MRTTAPKPTADLFKVNCPGGPFAEVRNAGIAGREVELRRLVDAVRRIVEAAPILDAHIAAIGRTVDGPDGETTDRAIKEPMDDLLARLSELALGDEERLARVLPPDPTLGQTRIDGWQHGPFGEADIRSSVRVGNPYGMVSGMYNPISPLVLDVEDERIVGYATFGNLYRATEDRGRSSTVHDGVVSACFDVVLAMANRLHGMFGPTMELTCTRRAPTRIGVPCWFEADVDWYRERVVVSSGRLVQEGVVTAEASGAFRRFDQVGVEAIGRLRGVVRGDVP